MSIVQSAQKAVGAVKAGRAYLDGLANKYIVKPVAAKGISGFVFDYEGESSISLASEITDHYIEDNTAIQDHIAKRPKRITLRGLVGELVMLKPAGLLGALGMAQSGLTQLYAYLGDNTPQMTQKLQEAATAVTGAINAFDQGLARVQNIVNMFDKSVPAQTKQQIAYTKLETLWDTNQIVTVDTPFKFFESMAIELVTCVQDPDTKTITDISVTLKEIRLAETETTKFDESNYSGRAGQQRQPVVDKGKTPGTTRPVSLLKQAFNGGAN